MIRRLFLFLALLLVSVAAHAGYFGPMTASVTTYQPSAPVSVSASSAGATSVTVSWSAGVVDSGHSAATSYNLYRSTSSGAETLWQSGVTSPYTDTGLATGTTYYYKVIAHNTAGDSTLSSEVSATPTSGVPSAPTGHSTVAGNASVTLHPGTASGATSYKYYLRATSDPTTSTYDATGTATDGQVISSLTNGTSYKVGYTAVNGSGESVLSTIDTATPSAGGTYTATFDGTAGTAPDTSQFTVITAGSGAGSLDGSGNLYIRGPSASTDGALVYRTTAITNTATTVYKVRAKTNTTLIADGAGGTAMQIIHAASKAAPLGTGNDNSIQGIDWVVLNSGGVLKAFPRYIDSSNQVHEWDNSAVNWTSAGSGSTNVTAITADTYYWFYLYTTSTGWSVQLRNAADSADVLAKTPEKAWSATVPLAGGESFWLRMGDKYSYAWQFGIYVDTYMEQ